MIELFPAGFEERDADGGIELVAYTDPGGEERLWQAFGGAAAADVEEGWEDRWREFHRPVRVGPLWVGPPWELPPPDVLAVVIDPGRAFGTGAHATTRLCLELLLERPCGSLIDIGCGSGVLAIAAAKLGFGPVLAIDLDPQAVEAAASNVAANEVAVDVKQADALVEPLPPMDVVVANITLAVDVSLGSILAAAEVVTSGYLASEAPVLAGYWRVERRSAEGWAADLHRRETQ